MVAGSIQKCQRLETAVESMYPLECPRRRRLQVVLFLSCIIEGYSELSVPEISEYTLFELTTWMLEVLQYVSEPTQWIDSHRISLPSSVFDQMGKCVLPA